VHWCVCVCVCLWKCLLQPTIQQDMVQAVINRRTNIRNNYYCLILQPQHLASEKRDSIPPMAANLVTAAQTAWDPPGCATLTKGKVTRDTKLTTHIPRGPGRINKVNLHSGEHINGAVLDFTVILWSVSVSEC